MSHNDELLDPPSHEFSAISAVNSDKMISQASQLQKPVGHMKWLPICHNECVMWSLNSERSELSVEGWMENFVVAAHARMGICVCRSS